MIGVDRVKLGRFVTNVEDPTFDYKDVIYRHPIDPIVETRVRYAGSQSGTQDAQYMAKLTKLLSAIFSKRTKTDLNVSSQCVKTYTLDNTRQWFHAAVRDPDTQKWLRNVIDSGDDVYYLCGFSTVTDTAFTQRRDASRDGGGQAEIPLGPVLAAAAASAGVPVVPNEQLWDSGVKVLRRKGSQETEQYEVPEEVVFAFQYRKVRHRYFSSKDLDKADLGKKAYWRVTERYMSEQDQYDSIEVYCVDDGWQPEGEWHQADGVDGEALLVMG